MRTKVLRGQQIKVNQALVIQKLMNIVGTVFLLHFVAFFHVALLFFTGADNKKVGVDNEKALDLDKRIFFSYFSLISM